MTRWANRRHIAPPKKRAFFAVHQCGNFPRWAVQSSGSTDPPPPEGLNCPSLTGDARGSPRHSLKTRFFVDVTLLCGHTRICRTQVASKVAVKSNGAQAQKYNKYNGATDQSRDNNPPVRADFFRIHRIIFLHRYIHNSIVTFSEVKVAQVIQHRIPSKGSALSGLLDSI